MGQTVNSKLFLVLLLGSLSAFGPFIMDLYLPALPQISQHFATSTSMTQLSLTSTMIGLSVGQLFLGPISDKFGRKKPLLISLSFYIASSLLIVFSPNMEMLIALRAIQGLSSAGSVVISRSIAADLYQGKQMTRFFGLLMSVNGLAPIISPVIGSLLLELTDWRGIFITLTLLGIVLMIAAWRLQESLAPEQRISGSVFATVKIFTEIVKNRLFMTFVLIQAFLFAAFFAYLSSSAFIFQEFYGLTAFQYSICFAINGTAMILGVNIAGKISNKTAFKLGLWGFLFGTIYTAVILILQANVWLVELGFLFLLLCIGFILPGSSALAMESERQYAGSASALLGFCPFFLGGIVSPLVGIGNIFYSTSMVLLIFAILAFVVYLSVKSKISSS